MIRTWAGIKSGEKEEEAWAKLETSITFLFNGGAAEQLPYIASLLSMNLRGEYVQQYGQLDGEVMGHRVYAASRRLFERLAEQRPVVLIFEDLHRLDDSSERLLEHLLPLATRSPVLFLLLSRADYSGSWNRLRETALRELAACYSEVHLTALTPVDAERMAGAMLEMGSVSPRLRDSIMSKSGGNPFFLEEIVSSLIDSNVLTSDQATGRWRSSSYLEEIAIPDTLLGVIMNRFDLLDDGAKRALRIASVIGRSFSYLILNSVCEADNKELGAKGLEVILDKIEAIDFIRKDRATSGAYYAFKHELARDAIYESILVQKRRELHVRVGEAIEALFAEQTERLSGILAYHFAQAESWEKAQNYLLKAGDRAERIAADGEALDSYRRAMEIYIDAFGTGWTPLQNASIERKMGETLLRRGDYISADGHLRKALHHLDKALPAKPKELGKEILSEALRQLGHLAFFRLFKRRQSSYLDSATQEEMSIHESLYWLFEPRLMMISSLKMLNVSERNGFAPGIVLGSAFFAFLIDYIPFLKGFARYYFRRALSLGAKVPDPGALMGPVHMVLAIHENSLGHWDAVRDHARRAIDAYEKGGDWDIRGWRFAIVDFADADIHQGNFRQALMHAQELVRLGDESADRVVFAWGLCRRGFAEKGLGRFRESTESLEKAMALLRAIPDYLVYLDAAGEYGQCHIRLGNLEKAILVFEECARLRTEHLAAGGPVCTRFLNGTAEALLATAEQSDADAKTSTLLRAKVACRKALAQGKLYPPGMPEAMMLRGRYEWLCGKRAGAYAWWKRSAALAEKMDVRYDLARTIFEMGHRLKNREHLERARSIFAEIGAEWDLSKARATLSSA
jgi:tetratricopeptide (TPR) repeat protein